MAPIPHPEKFLEIRVNNVTSIPPLTAACAGYEVGKWRCEQLAKHTLQWLPEFALRYSEWSNLTHSDAVAKVAKAALLISESEDYKRRGEFGEILLHILLRQHIGTIPAISKVFFKDSRNDTVKGFDAVHVVEAGPEFELWLGEAKFYTNIGSAIHDVIAELAEHTDSDYLRDEFLAITNKIDDLWPKGAELRALLSRNRSLDATFSALCIPVLLTYDSAAVASHNSATEAYKKAFEKEVLKHWESFRDKLPTLPIRVYLFLLPLHKKEELVRYMHECLKYAQGLV
ncbi:MAG TPA: DUF1837 domain-containing protein [Thermodesulfobacteriota bacterium]|nr:DUF1837 domain-containing protein [Thermodesulfobacteriota bacterium]